MKKTTLTLLSTLALLHGEMIRDDTKEVVTDTTTKLMWQDNAEAKTVEKEWKEAKQYCEDLKLGGYSDWFLPTVDELLTITDVSKSEPAISSVFKNVESRLYFSSSPCVSYEGYAWNVSFGKGSTVGFFKTWGNNVRCARDSTGTSKLVTLHNKKLAKADQAVKIAQAEQAKEKANRAEAQAEIKKLEQQAAEIEMRAREEEAARVRRIEQYRIQEKNEKTAESINKFVGGVISIAKDINKAKNGMVAKLYGVTLAQCEQVKIYYDTTNIGRGYKQLQKVRAGSEIDFQCKAATMGATAIVDAEEDCRTAAVVKSGFFSKSVENETTCKYTGTAVK